MKKTVEVCGEVRTKVEVSRIDLLEYAVKVARSQAKIEPDAFVRNGEMIVDHGRHRGGEEILPFDAWKVQVLEACQIFEQIRREIIKE